MVREGATFSRASSRFKARPPQPAASFLTLQATVAPAAGIIPHSKARSPQPPASSLTPKHAHLSRRYHSSHFKQRSPQPPASSLTLQSTVAQAAGIIPHTSIDGRLSRWHHPSHLQKTFRRSRRHHPSLQSTVAPTARIIGHSIARSPQPATLQEQAVAIGSIIPDR